MNKKNKLNYQNDYVKSLFIVMLMSISLFLVTSTYSSSPDPKGINKCLPLFGHFYPAISTNTLSIPNVRIGSGIR